MPQSRSRLTARAASPCRASSCIGRTRWDAILYGLPISTGATMLSCLSRGRYQCLVSRITGWLPLMALFGLIRSVGLRLVPHFALVAVSALCVAMRTPAGDVAVGKESLGFLVVVLHTGFSMNSPLSYSLRKNSGSCIVMRFEVVRLYTSNEMPNSLKRLL